MFLALALTAVTLSANRTDELVETRVAQLLEKALATSTDARASARLFEAEALLDDVDDLTQLIEPLSKLIARHTAHPAVRAQARRLLADVERARGRVARADDVTRPLGIVRDFYVVGGFENEAKSGCDTDFGPESSLQLNSAYPAQAGDVGWVRVQTAAPNGYVNLAGAVRPSNEVVVYALAILKSDVEARTDLWLGTSGAFRLFVNGVKALDSKRYNQPRPDQSRVSVQLRRGQNRILLKLCQASGPLGFFLRTEGARLVSELPPSLAPLERGPPPTPQVKPTAADDLAAAARQKKGDAALLADAALVAFNTRSFDDTAREPLALIRKAVELKPNDVNIRLAAAEIDGDDHNEKKKHLEAALAADPKSPWVRAAVADHELARDRPADALALLEPLVADAPTFARARLLTIRALEALQERGRAALFLEESLRALPHTPSVLRLAASQSRRLERATEALAQYRAVAAVRYTDLGARRALAELLADSGEVSTAIEQLQVIEALDPNDISTRLRTAELLAANGRLPDALNAFASIEAVAGADPEVFERKSRVFLLAGRKDEAIAAMSRSLALHAQNPGLKEALRSLKGDDAASLPPPALPIPPTAAIPAAWLKEDAVVLVDSATARVQPSGQASNFQQLVIRVLTDRGVEAYRSYPISYSPDRQEVRVLKARVTKADGSINDGFSDAERSLNEPWSGMYYDARVRLLSFPNLEKGDTLEISYRVDDTANENLLADYFGAIDTIAGIHPKLRYAYTVEMPASRPLYWNKSTLPAWVQVQQTTLPDGRVSYRFEANEVKKVVPEPMMPGFGESVTNLHVSTYKSWDDVGRYFWALVKDQLTPNDELKRTVDQVLKKVDRKNKRAVVEALYGFVVTNTRYVALEFGIHGFKPYRVDRVLARRFGDCKDKASLLVAMLGLAGVDARLTLLRMRHLGRIAPEPASLAAFNHAIAYVPSLDLYLDGTAEFVGSTELPSGDRQANVLRIEPAGNSVFTTTPEAAPDANTTAVEMDVALRPDGSAELKGVSTFSGQAAPEQRRLLATSTGRNQIFEQAWAQQFPGLSLKSLTVSDLSKLEAPVKESFTFQAPRFAEASPGLLRFFMLGTGRAFTQALAGLTERQQVLELPNTWTNTFVVRYRMPPGFTPDDVPVEFQERSAFGAYRLSAKIEGDLLVARGEMTLSETRIAPADYPAFRAWLSSADQAFGRKLVVRRRGGQTASLPQRVPGT